jgi:hypothetical protein
MRIFFFFGDPLLGLGLLVASIPAAIVGTLTGNSRPIFLGVALALSGVGLLVLTLLLSLEALNGWASGILSGITSLHDEEIKKLANAQRRPSEPRPMSRFRN